VFNDPTFRMAETTVAASFVSVNDKYISNQSLHEIRLDEGEVALVWIDNKCVALHRIASHRFGGQRGCLLTARAVCVFLPQTCGARQRRTLRCLCDHGDDD
jgi:hypothetical protein